MTKINVGEMACETCGRVVVVKQNEHGTLSYRCDYCDAAPYQRKETIAAATWRKKLTPFAAKEESAPAPAADKPARSTIFG